jgi:hypothetical protein
VRRDSRVTSEIDSKIELKRTDTAPHDGTPALGLGPLNENVENASECMNMHLNAYGKKQHHFREKTTLIPAGAAAALLGRKFMCSARYQRGGAR